MRLLALRVSGQARDKKPGPGNECQVHTSIALSCCTPPTPQYPRASNSSPSLPPSLPPRYTHNAIATRPGTTCVCRHNACRPRASHPPF
ncbi:unnamed protein product [Protopolystoma xenopodis]|uniref:Uncharacterized protein n=1 Tax=Protopolystoma xenopodis TaxID=117903 RepID=A0A3S5FE01_9PLAT|nr:unnamed protein product [Protopolystoma xenopodis]